MRTNRITVVSSVAGAAVVCLALAVTVVSAHMALQKSMPEKDAVLTSAPDEIQLWFTQDPDPALSNLSLVSDEREIELGETRMMAEKSVAANVPALDPGTYTVRWRSAGDDGHVQRGEFAFTIRAAD